MQIEWDTKTAGKQHMCADFSIWAGAIEDCSGQCVNGAICMNGHC